MVSGPESGTLVWGPHILLPPLAGFAEWARLFHMVGAPGLQVRGP